MKLKIYFLLLFWVIMVGCGDHDAKFNIGDVVCLKCGGPKMVIYEISIDLGNQYSCSWQSQDGKLHSGVFYEWELVLVGTTARPADFK